MLRHRLTQVVRYLFDRPAPDDLGWAKQMLGPAAKQFEAMSRPDRAHALRVARRFEALDPPGWAIQGALLHDAGKPPGFGLFWRILVVLSPGDRGPSDPPERRPLRRARQIHHWHGLYGAREAESLGLSRETVAFVCHHQDPDQAERIPWIRLFQAIDDD